MSENDNVPFIYPGSRIIRRHAPAGYTDYTSFKPWLRDEFTFRCAFCLLRERMCEPDGQDRFTVDHLKSKSLNPSLECEYSNLVYACTKCNSFKGESGPILDPCRAAYARHLQVNDDGTIRGLTAQGRILIRIMRLDRDGLNEFRRGHISIAKARADPREQGEETMVWYLRYPKDMPDLRTLRPPDNRRPESTDTCYLARSQRGELDKMY